MRLVGLALLVAWLVAWSAAPHGEPARSTSIVGAVACAGGDSVAAAWLELRHGTRDGVVRVAIIGPDGIAKGEPFHVVVSDDAVGFRLSDAGDGTFIFVAEHHTQARRWLELHRIGRGHAVELRPLRLTASTTSWQIATAGDEVLVAVTDPQTEPGGSFQDHAFYFIGDRTVRTEEQFPRNQPGWLWHSYSGGRLLIGAGGNHVVKYEVGEPHSPGAPAANDLVVAGVGVWEAEVSRPPCRGFSGKATVTSVVGLRGGYARLSRKGAVGCVDGIRDGAPFMYENVPLAGIASARLAVDPAGHFSVYEEQDSQVTRRRVVLPDDRRVPPTVDTTIHPRLDHGGVRYRIFAGDGLLGVTDVATRVTTEETQVVLERHGAGGAQVLAPARRFLPDARPLLRWLSLLPLGALFVSLLGGLRLGRRLARLRPIGAEALPVAGPAVIEGTLATDADAPAGGLRIRVGRQLVTLFVEGADVLRASAMRPRSQPRGDAVDVAAGAPVVASGVVETGIVYRDDAQLRAGPGDLVLVGCTVAEARARVTRRLLTSLALCTTAALLVTLVVAR